MEDLSMQAAAAPVTQAAAPGATGSAWPAQFDPADTRLFAEQMQAGKPGASHAPVAAVGQTQVPAVLQSLADNMRTRPIEDIQRSMLAAIDTNDPTKTMVAMANFSAEVTGSMSRLHLSTSLASAAISLFGGLLKNQQ